jgi:hypothetical protein
MKTVVGGVAVGVLVFAGALLLTGGRGKGGPFRRATAKTFVETAEKRETVAFPFGRTAKGTAVEIPGPPLRLDARHAALRRLFLQAAAEYAEQLTDKELQLMVTQLRDETLAKQQAKQAVEKEASRELDAVQRTLSDITRKYRWTRAAGQAQNMINARWAPAGSFRGTTRARRETTAAERPFRGQTTAVERTLPSGKTETTRPFRFGTAAKTSKE